MRWFNVNMSTNHISCISISQWLSLVIEQWSKSNIKLKRLVIIKSSKIQKGLTDVKEQIYRSDRENKKETTEKYQEIN